MSEDQNLKKNKDRVLGKYTSYGRPGVEPTTEPAEATSIYINLRVHEPDGSVVHFKIKRNTQLKKLMQAYCDRQGYQMSSVRFMFDGCRINPEETPSELKMEEDDPVEIFWEQGPHLYKKPTTELPDANSQINLKVLEPDGDTVVHFKIKRSTELKKLMMAFCERQGLPLDCLRFQFGGKRLEEDSTPMDLKMEEGDTIEVFHSIGGPLSDVKPTSELPEANPLINLKFLGPVDDTVVRFKVKRSTQMKKVMKAFSEQQKLFPMESLRFLHNGVRIRGDLTPMDLEMEDDDTIDVFWEALGA